MKILFLTDFIPPRSIGGAAQSVWRVVQQLHAWGHEVYVVATVQEKQYEGLENRDGIVIYNIYTNYDDRYRAWVSIYNTDTISKVESILREVCPEVIHADVIHYYLSYATLKIAHKYAKKVFLTARDFMMVSYGKLELKNHECGSEYFKVRWWDNLRQAKKRFNPFRNIMIRHYLKYVDQIFSNSKSLADFLSINKIPGVVPIHNGLIMRDVSVEQSEIDNFKKTYRIEGGSLILFPARVSPAKGLYVLMDAMKKVIVKVPSATLAVVGVQERDQVPAMEYARDFGIEKNMILLGWTIGHDLDVVYSAAGMVLVPSLYPDPFPTVNLDAALYKKPVITTCFGGAKEFVIDNKTGYIINPFNNDLLVEKMIDLLQDSEKTKQFGFAAYDRLRTDFTIEKQTEKLLRWYTGALMPGKRNSPAKR